MLPVPNLDDRRFQDLVDDAKRLVQQRCPTWTDHNVSDPGVTLIEAFAQMVDQLIYRLNRVPDAHYLKFLELIGVQLRPPAAAHGQVTFWLSAPQPQTVRIRAETQVATPRTDVNAAVVFSTTAPLDVVPCTLDRAGAQSAQLGVVDQTASLGRGGFSCFGAPPAPGDALLLGLSAAVPSCAVLLRLECRVSGRGVDPTRPPVVWEALGKDGWQACDLERDGTGGLNRNGDVLIHVPPGHQETVLADVRAGWLRCRLVEAEDGQPTYSAPPTVLAASASSMGGTVETSHAEVVHGEVLGRSDGTPGQRFTLTHHPVLRSEEPGRLAVTILDEEHTWRQVHHFADSGPDDPHFRIDDHAGVVELGPAVRAPDGQLRNYGRIPPAGAVLRLEAYRIGGGRIGNVARGQVRVLKTSVPYVARVENRTPASGGAEAETLADARTRGPLLLRSRGRAVTAGDFEELAADLAPDAARLFCVNDPDDPCGIRLLVVPHAASDDLGAVTLADLQPSESMLARIGRGLDDQRLIGTRLLVQPPAYVGLTVVVRVSAHRHANPTEVHRSVISAVYGLLHPLSGGAQGSGWPFGQGVQGHEVYSVVARTTGVDLSREVRVQLFPADPRTGRRGPEVTRLDVPKNALVFSYDHQVRIMP